jgi:hypothetical protein
MGAPYVQHRGDGCDRKCHRLYCTYVHYTSKKINADTESKESAAPAHASVGAGGVNGGTVLRMGLILSSRTYRQPCPTNSTPSFHRDQQKTSCIGNPSTAGRQRGVRHAEVCEVRMVTEMPTGYGTPARVAERSREAIGRLQPEEPLKLPEVPTHMAADRDEGRSDTRAVSGRNPASARARMTRQALSATT